MVIYAGMTGQTTRRTAAMVTAQRCRRQAVVDVDHVSMHRRRAAVVHHARIRRRTAQCTGNTVMIAGKGRIRVMGQAMAGAESLMTSWRVYVIYRSRDRHRRWMMVSSGGGGAGLIHRTGTCNDNATFHLFYEHNN